MAQWPWPTNATVLPQRVIEETHRVPDFTRYERELHSARWIRAWFYGLRLHTLQKTPNQSSLADGQGPHHASRVSRRFGRCILPWVGRGGLKINPKLADD